jgi:hypothetical protein
MPPGAPGMNGSGCLLAGGWRRQADRRLRIVPAPGQTPCCTQRQKNRAGAGPSIVSKKIETTIMNRLVFVSLAIVKSPSTDICDASYGLSRFKLTGILVPHHGSA